VAQAAGYVRPLLPAFGEHVVLTAVLRGDAGRNAIVMWLERGREALVPAEILQVQSEAPFRHG
jgi:hypothetical protein